MEIQYLNVKLYSDGSGAPNLADFIPVFHNWIQSKALDEMLIDVADYSHVPAGPGVILIGHEANYSLEYGPEDKFGLLYNMKVRQEGSNQERIRYALRQAAKAAVRLQEECPDAAPAFPGREVRLTANRRTITSNTAETLPAFRQDLESVFDDIYGASQYSLRRVSADARERFTVDIGSDTRVELIELMAAEKSQLSIGFE